VLSPKHYGKTIALVTLDGSLLLQRNWIKVSVHKLWYTVKGSGSGSCGAKDEAHISDNLFSRDIFFYFRCMTLQIIL